MTKDTLIIHGTNSQNDWNEEHNYQHNINLGEHEQYDMNEEV